jgi:organic hydroperoxide reductase OsmC/OhrA
VSMRRRGASSAPATRPAQVLHAGREVARRLRTPPCGAHEIAALRPGAADAADFRMAIAPFPHTYSVELHEDLLTAEPRAAVRGGAPPQFGGSDEVWSPEHLLTAAALLCLKTTFDAHARHNKLAIYAWHGGGTAELVKGPQGPVFTSIELSVELVTDAGLEDRVQQLLEKAEKQCIVSRALNVPVHLKARVTALETIAA